MTPWPDFEGAPLPAGDALAQALQGDAASRARLVRAAVVHAPFAAAVVATCQALFADGAPRPRGAAIHAAHALLARALIGPLAEAVAADALVGVADPFQPGRSLAYSALLYLAEVAPPWDARARAALAHGLSQPELRPLAWRVIGADAPEAVLPHLGALLTEQPALADEVGTRFALLFPTHCEAAAAAVAPLPLATREAFAAALEKHLLRVHAVKRWVACRRLLLGR
ncbi:MAG: hypothetical protein H6706_15405 [Myxococcales bacterium]|nr:hypothetical protein [Myxococcales bacterium]